MRDITVDELNTYLYCGEYYKQYLSNKNIELYDDRTPPQLMYFILIKWLIAYKCQHGICPTEEQVIIKIAQAISTLEKHGHKIVFASYINDIHLSLLEFRNLLQSIHIKKALSINRYVRSGCSLSYLSLLETKDTVYLFSYLPYRHAMNSPQVLIPLIESQDKEHVLIQIVGNTLVYRDIGKEKLDLNKADCYYTNAMKALALELYIPIHQCTKTSCPNYGQCHIARK